MSKLALGLWMLVALALLVAAGGTYACERAFVARAHGVDGHVVEVSTIRGRDGRSSVSHSLVRWLDGGGAAHESTFSTGAYAQGARVPLLYDPEDPAGTVRLRDAGAPFPVPTLVFAALGLAFALIGVKVVIGARRRRAV